MKFFNSIVTLSITNKLVFWFIFLAVIPFLFIGSIVTKLTVDSIKKEVFNNLSATTEARALEVKTHVNKKKKEITQLAHLPNIASSVYKLTQIYQKKGVYNSEYKAINRQIREYLLCFYENSGYKDIFLISPNGDIVFTINKNLDFSINLNADTVKETELGKLFNDVILLKSTQISDYKWYESFNESVAFIATPIVRKDVFFGVFVVILGSNDIYELMCHRSGFAKSSDIVLVAREKDSLVYRACSNYQQKDSKNNKILIGSKDLVPFQKAVQGLEGVELYTNDNRVDMVASYRYIPELHWGIVIQLDKNEAVKPITNLVRTIVIIGLITLLVVIILVVIVSKSISNPIVTLIKSSRLIAKDNKSAKAHVKASDELHDLAVSFNNMLTERKRSEDALHTSEERLKKILNSSPDSIIVIDLNGKILDCNQMLLDTFYISTKEEFIGSDSLDLVDPSDRKKAKLHIQKTLKYGSSKHIDYYCRTRHGNKFPVEVSASTILDIQNNPQSFIIIARDISERKKAEQELFRSNQELEQFAYIASHDLKAPLRAIRQISTWVEEDLQDIMKDDTKKQMELLRSRVVRMENLLNGLLEYSRIGRTKVEKELVNTRDLIEDIKDFYNPPEGFIIEPADELPVFETHRVPFEQIFRNLVGNAIKYHNRHDGSIRITVNNSSDFYEFLVIDDGPGIAPQFHTKIFEMFQRLKSRDEIEGSGMGLALVKKIVDNYKGSIAINSDIGKGSTFTFTWPKAI